MTDSTLTTRTTRFTLAQSLSYVDFLRTNGRHTVDGNFDSFAPVCNSCLRDWQVSTYPSRDDAFTLAIGEERERFATVETPSISPVDAEIATLFPGAHVLSDGSLAKLRTLIRARLDAEAIAARLTAQLQAARTAEIDPSDERLHSLWVQAAEAADEAGYCEVYDNLAEAVGIPSRRDLGLNSRSWNVNGSVEITITVPITMTVMARYEEEALEQVSDDANTIERAIRYGEASIYTDDVDLSAGSIASVDWEEAEEAN